VTLITNTFCNEFSIFCADRMAKTSGPTEVKAAGFTIKSDQGISVIGYNKITNSFNNEGILGISGDANAHTYTGNIKNRSFSEWIELILSHLDGGLNVNKALSQPIATINANQGIACQYDGDRNRYIAFFYQFNEFSKSIAFHESTDQVQTMSIGSGALSYNHLNSLPQLGLEYQKIIDLTSVDEKIKQSVNLLKKRYKAISAFDEFVSEQIDIWISTDSNPAYRKLDSS
jgi:hypothetical protein